LWYGTFEAAYMHFLVTNWQICKCTMHVYVWYLLSPQRIVGAFQLSGVKPMYIQQLLKNMCFL